MTEITSPGWHRGDWMQTFAGHRFYPMAPAPEDVDPVDIAHALSLICRYGGHAARFYSVAEHCVHVSYAVPAEHALWGLLHDAAEAYVGDMVRPLKRQLPAYQEAEERVIACIAARFNLPPMGSHSYYPDTVIDVDNRILLNERAAILTATEYSWGVDDLEPLADVVIHGWGPNVAEQAYARRLRELVSPEVLRG